MNRWTVAAIIVLTIFAIGASALVLWNGTGAGSRVERHGTTLIVHGRGSDLDLGYLAAGRYTVWVEQDHGCATRLTLIGADGADWFTLDFHAINWPHLATTGEIPGQDYRVHTEVFFGGGGLGPRTTPRPISDCTYTYEVAPA